jgi:uncharacterized membrane protein
MWLSYREAITTFHGMGLGAFFLLLFTGTWVMLWGLRSGWVTSVGVEAHRKLLAFGAKLMAVLAWLTVILGTYLPYTWYRAKPPAGADLIHFPRSFLLANPKLAFLHSFGMEWKEHVAWLTPILATAAAYLIWRYGGKLAENAKVRNAALTLLTLSFVAAAIAGLIGAFITKAAPLR